MFGNVNVYYCCPRTSVSVWWKCQCVLLLSPTLLFCDIVYYYPVTPMCVVISVLNWTEKISNLKNNHVWDSFLYISSKAGQGWSDRVRGRSAGREGNSLVLDDCLKGHKPTAIRAVGTGSAVGPGNLPMENVGRSLESFTDIYLNQLSNNKKQLKHLLN